MRFKWGVWGSVVLVGCTPPTERGPDTFRAAVEAEAGQNPAPDGQRAAGITLSIDQFMPGAETTFTLTGAGANELAHFARTSGGLGAGPCFGTANALCLDIVNPLELQGSASADASGTVTLVQTIPEIAPLGADLWFQAVIPRGASGLLWVKSNVVQLTIADVLTPATMGAGDLLITEVMLDPAAVADARGEWIEVRNVSGRDANLDGLTVTDGVNNVTLSGRTVLADGDYLVLGVNDDPSLNGGVAVDREVSGLSLANQFGEVALLSGATLIDAVGWDNGSSFPLVPGHSLALDIAADHLDNDLGQNWCASDVAYGGGDLGSPGQINHPCTQSLVDLSLADAKLIGEGSTDYAGYSVSSAGDVNGDGFDDILVGAYEEDEGGTDAGAAYLVHGPVLGDIDLSSAAAKLIGEGSSDEAGRSVSGAGDVNGDGFDDLLVGAWGNDEGGSSAGAAYLVYGPVAGDVSLSLADARLVGEASSDLAGGSVSSAGDVDGDGFSDLLVGADGNDEGGSSAGAAYLMYGPVGGNIDLSLADAKLIGEATSDDAGASVSSAGDVNGDGFDDLLIGAPYNDEGGSSAGAAYLVYGPILGDLDLSLADAKLIGETTSDYAGSSVSSAGDVNGDGFDDLLVGAPHNDEGGIDAGAAYLVHGPVLGNIDLSQADAKLIGEDGSDNAGEAVSSAGDVNGDGYDDLLVGTDIGEAYLVLGPVLGDVVLTDAAIRFLEESVGDDAGSVLSGAGDVDGDGRPDLLLGAPFEDDGGSSAGAAYLLLGGPLF